MSPITEPSSKLVDNCEFLNLAKHSAQNSEDVEDFADTIEQNVDNIIAESLERVNSIHDPELSPVISVDLSIELVGDDPLVPEDNSPPQSSNPLVKLSNQTLETIDTKNVDDGLSINGSTRNMQEPNLINGFVKSPGSPRPTNDTHDLVSSTLKAQKSNNNITNTCIDVDKLQVSNGVDAEIPLRLEQNGTDLNAVETNVAENVEQINDDQELFMRKARVVEAKTIDRREIIACIVKNMNIKDSLVYSNLLIQYKLASLIKEKRHEEKIDSADQDQRYSTGMESVLEIQIEILADKVSHQKSLDDFHLQLSEKTMESNQQYDKLLLLRRNISLKARGSQSNKIMLPRDIDQMENKNRKREIELNAMRLKVFKSRNKLRRHDTLLKQKKNLGDGLHLIDFEQLKIENQTFSVKIAERNESLAKLRSQVTNTVREMTHVKEKSEYVKVESQGLKLVLGNLDARFSLGRDNIFVSKKYVKNLRNKNDALRQQNGLLVNEVLLLDYEKNYVISPNKKEIESLKNTILSLQQKHDELEKVLHPVTGREIIASPAL